MPVLLRVDKAFLAASGEWDEGQRDVAMVVSKGRIRTCDEMLWCLRDLRKAARACQGLASRSLERYERGAELARGAS